MATASTATISIASGQCVPRDDLNISLSGYGLQAELLEEALERLEMSVDALKTTLEPTLRPLVTFAPECEKADDGASSDAERRLARITERVGAVAACIGELNERCCFRRCGETVAWQPMHKAKPP